MGTSHTPRWRRFIWQGAVLLLLALIAAAVSTPALGIAIGAVGALLLLAGLVGAATT